MGKPTSGLAWRPITIEGTTYDLAHLHPYIWEVVIPGKEATGKQPAQPERKLRVNVSFGLHCFARDRLPGEEVNADRWYADNRERRVFCFDRWELSRQLPGIIATLAERRCMHTGREEFVTLEVPLNGRTLEYAVFFTVTKAGKATQADLNLFVNSAHERFDPLKYTKPIRFHFILLNRYQGKEIKPPR